MNKLTNRITQGLLFLILMNFNYLHGQDSFDGNDITLEDCYEWSMINYPLVQRLGIIEKSTEYNLRNANIGNLPQINLNGQATYQSAVTELPIDIPNLDIPTIDKDQYKAYLEVYQPLSNFWNVKLSKNMIQQNENIEKQKLEVDLYQLKERVNQIFFGTLMLEEKITQLEIIRTDLDTMLVKMEASIENGLATPTDQLILDVERISIQQQIEESKSNQTAFLLMLSTLTGKQITDVKNLVAPSSSTARNQINRPELRLFDLQNQTIALQNKQLDNSILPNVGLFGQAGYGRPALNFLSNDFDFYYIGGIKFNWNLANFYNYKRSKNSVSLGTENIAIQKETFLLNTNLAQTQQNTEIAKYRSLIETDQRIIKIREDVLATAEVQLNSGLITSMDYVRFLNEVSKARQSLALHETQLLLAEATLKVTTGN